jgi:Raf kinase inhibitor-like YbhB/YbcL family protein
MTMRWVGTLAGSVIAAYGVLGIDPGRAVDHPDLFVVTSPDLADNAMLKPANAGTGKSPRGPWQCGGSDVSPALAWSHAPADTKSFAVLMDDPDAASGRGGSHWVMYDIPATATALARGAGGDPASRFVGGANGRKLTIYSGPCAEPGAKAHHFIFMVFALDIAPGVLAKGLGRDEFMQQIQGHNLAEASLVARYQRPLPRPQQ